MPALAADTRSSPSHGASTLVEAKVRIGWTSSLPQLVKTCVVSSFVEHSLYPQLQAMVPTILIGLRKFRVCLHRLILSISVFLCICVNVSVFTLNCVKYSHHHSRKMSLPGFIFWGRSDEYIVCLDVCVCTCIYIDTSKGTTATYTWLYAFLIVCNNNVYTCMLYGLCYYFLNLFLPALTCMGMTNSHHHWY